MSGDGWQKHPMARHFAAGHKNEPPWGPRWHRKRRGIARRIIGLLLFIGILVAGGMATLAFVFTHLFDGSGQTTLLVWLGGLVLAIVLPLMALGLGLNAVRSVALPLTDIVAALDAAADGDLSQRVREEHRGPMGRLARSYNQMADELEKADRRRRNLTADVAHELRTPLHIIQGNLEGILDGIYEPSEDHLEATLEETRQLARLVEDLRLLSLAESGEMTLVLETIDVDDLLADVVTSFEGLAEEKGIRLSIEKNRREVDHPLTISADGGRLDQVLANLISNGLRHTPQGGEIVLSTGRDANEVWIRVRDTGDGISEEDLPFVFDRLWRGDRSLASQDHRSGLGLAIARQLVRAHGGDIDVNSRFGEGSEFVVRLPLDAREK